MSKYVVILKKKLMFNFLSVLRGHSFFSSTPQQPMTSNFKGFSTPDFIHHIYLPILILEKEPVFFFLNDHAEPTSRINQKK